MKILNLTTLQESILYNAIADRINTLEHEVVYLKELEQCEKCPITISSVRLNIEKQIEECNRLLNELA